MRTINEESVILTRGGGRGLGLFEPTQLSSTTAPLAHTFGPNRDVRIVSRVSGVSGYRGVEGEHT